MVAKDALREVIEGADLTDYGLEDQATLTLALDAIDNALADADALILSYGIPATVQTALLARLASTIALYFLQSAERLDKPEMGAYEAAIGTLKAHARGELNLIPPAPGTPEIEGDVITIASNSQRYGGSSAVDEDWQLLTLTPLIKHLTPKPEGFAEVWFKKVAGAAEYAQLSVDNLPLPACWIIRAADKVTHAGERAEDTDFSFDVVIAVENVRDHQVGETDDLLLKYRLAVKVLLLGWQPAPDVNPIKWDGGRVLEYSRGDLLWADKYTFNALITNYLDDPEPYQSITYTGENL